MSNVVDFPDTAKIGFIRSALERERRMRDRVLKGDSRTKGMQEMSQCLLFLKDIESKIHSV